LLWLCLWCCSTLGFRTVCCCCCLRLFYPLIITTFAPHIFVFSLVWFYPNSQQVQKFNHIFLFIFYFHEDYDEINLYKLVEYFYYLASVQGWIWAHRQNCWSDRPDSRRVLLVLNGIESIEKFKMIAAGRHDWFASGSRMVLTTRDAAVLDNHDVEIEKYKLIATCLNSFVGMPLILTDMQNILNICLRLCEIGKDHLLWKDCALNKNVS